MVSPRKKRILIVDDDEDIRALLVTLLERAGYEVRAAGTGEKGLKCLVQTRYDLLITDILMPVMTGIELMQELKRRETLLMPRILVLSAEPGRLREVEPRSLPVHRVERKPFEHTKLLSVVGELLERA